MGAVLSKLILGQKQRKVRESVERQSDVLVRFGDLSSVKNII